MAEQDTLLAHLAPWVNENIAIEALGYVLNKSAASREAMNSVLLEGGVDIGPVDKVKTQVTLEGGARPDLVGYSGSDAMPLFIEAKFDAVLTSNQPNGYLDWLRAHPADGDSVLLFLVSERRIGTLWPELRRLVESAGGGLSDTEAARRCMRVDGTRIHLMVVSWRSLLNSMATRTRAAGEPPGIEADIGQLSGLARRKNDEAFVPFSDEYVELGARLEERRRLDFQRLVNDATERGVEAGWADKGGLNVVRRAHDYGRYLRLSDVVVWFGLNDERWKNGEAPLGIEFTWPKEINLQEILGKLELAENWVPIDLRPDVDYQKVLGGVVSRLEEISGVIAETSMPSDSQ